MPPQSIPLSGRKTGPLRPRASALTPPQPTRRKAAWQFPVTFHVPLYHCEERNDEAISILRMRDCFAALAMTYSARSRHCEERNLQDGLQLMLLLSIVRMG